MTVDQQTKAKLGSLGWEVLLRLCARDQISLIWFYGISTIVGYLMPSPVFTHILNIWFVKTFYKYTQLHDQTVLFLTFQFSISQQS